ncbi:MAG TPA: hypothetical protein VGF21_19785 [Thermoleophilaceae bacterium]|jgi:pimeloyl-ACP methyl ester carboxylesterase
MALSFAAAVGLDPETGDFPGERVFASSVDVKYVLREASERPDVLLVVFSSAQQPGKPPRYRWHKQLADVPCHRLFVLDDQGPRDPLPGPSWYLGRHPGGGFADSVCELVERTIVALGVERSRVATVGSSMGGFAALYFGARLRTGLAIAGEPQTLLGRYLCSPPFEPLAAHIIGGDSPEHRDALNGILFDALREGAPAAIDLYCGDGSHHHERHVAPLAEFLDEQGLRYELELDEGFDHDDFGPHFASHLTRRIDEMLAGQAR